MTVIVTKRLMLKNYEYGDDPWIIPYAELNTMVKWLNDPEIVRYSEQRHQKHDLATQKKYILHGPTRFRMVYSGRNFIGTITAHIDKNNSVANVGILIGEKKEWGKGYGTEAWQAFCDHLLTHGIRKIEAGAMACNFGMIHIFRKTGMHLEGARSGHFQLGDELIDLVQWARFL